ncbi:UNVERIFIED_ORG: hypothetical protein FHW05_002321 [Pantoea agglomerans]
MTETTDNAGAVDNSTAQPTPGAEQQNGNAQTLLGGLSQTQEQASNTVLGSAATQPPAAEPGKPAPFSFPEKFQVKNGDDLDFTASAQKMSEAYTNLEKRFGAGEARPSDINGYKFSDQFGDGFGERFMTDPATKPFLEKAHELGLNNAQLNFMVGELIASAPSQAETATGFSPDQAKQDLQQTWKEPSEFNRNMVAADRAAKFGFGDDYQRCIARYGNDPAIIRLLAKVGSELSEDSIRLGGMPQMSAESIDDLMRSDAYRDTKHPDHRRVSQQVRNYWQKTAGTDEVH